MNPPFFLATLVAEMEQRGTERHVRYWLYVAAAIPEQRLIFYEGKSWSVRLNVRFATELNFVVRTGPDSGSGKAK